MNDEFQPIADIWPLMSEDQLESLAADIRENGLHTPIWRHKDGRIVDGRNRWLACKRAGVPCPDRILMQSDRQLIPFVISLNLKRRHLKEGQRAMVAARLAKLRPGSNQFSPKEVASIEATSEAAENTGISEPEAGQLLNVSRSSVQRARAVLEHGAPDMVLAVEQGTMSVSRAHDEIGRARLRAKAEQAPAAAKKPAAGKGKRKCAGKAAASPLAARPPELVRFTLWLRNAPG
jgi:ParB-like chromosome segregation protein Spo0J